MLKLHEQDRRIEETRIQLNTLVAAKAFNLMDPEVIALSDILDQLIVDFERNKNED